MYSNTIEIPVTQWEIITWLILFRSRIKFNITPNYKEVANFHTVLPFHTSLLIPEAAVRRCSWKLFLKILQCSHKNTCVTLAQRDCETLRQRVSGTSVSCEFLKISKNTFSYRTPSVDASVVMKILGTPPWK